MWSHLSPCHSVSSLIGLCVICAPVSLSELMANHKVVIKTELNHSGEILVQLARLFAQLIIYYFSRDENVPVYLLPPTSCLTVFPNVLLNDFHQPHVRSAAYTLKLRTSNRLGWILMEALWVIGEFIHRRECKSRLDESRIAQLPLCKVNEKHLESGQICREHHWSWPTRSMISEIKGRRREGNLFTVSRESAKGNSSPQAVFEKLKGESKED